MAESVDVVAAFCREREAARGRARPHAADVRVREVEEANGLDVRDVDERAVRAGPDECEHFVGVRAVAEHWRGACARRAACAAPSRGPWPKPKTMFASVTAY
jgi:hypothetical protein